MTDWRGEHLIRGIQPSHEDRIAENARLAQVVTKLRGKGKPSRASAKKHGRIIGLALKGMKK